MVLQWHRDKKQLALLGGRKQPRDPRTKPQRHRTVHSAADEPLQQCDGSHERHRAV